MRPARIVLGSNQLLWIPHAPIEMGKFITVPSCIAATAFIERISVCKLCSRCPGIFAAPVAGACLCFSRKTEKGECHDQTTGGKDAHDGIPVCTRHYTSGAARFENEAVHEAEAPILAPLGFH